MSMIRNKNKSANYLNPCDFGNLSREQSRFSDESRRGLDTCAKNIEISRFGGERRNDPIRYISCCRISGISIYLFFFLLPPGSPSDN